MKIEITLDATVYFTKDDLKASITVYMTIPLLVTEDQGMPVAGIFNALLAFKIFSERYSTSNIKVEMTSISGRQTGCDFSHSLCM